MTDALEERIRRELLGHLGAGSPRDQLSFRSAARAVLGLIRQEQEAAQMWTDIGKTSISETENWHEMVRAWWKGHHP